MLRAIFLFYGVVMLARKGTKGGGPRVGSRFNVPLGPRQQRGMRTGPRAALTRAIQTRFARGAAASRRRAAARRG